MGRKPTVSFAPVRQKMKRAGLDDLLIRSFEHHYAQLVAGATGYIPGTHARPPQDIADRPAALGYHAQGLDALSRLVVVKTERWTRRHHGAERAEIPAGGEE